MNINVWIKEPHKEVRRETISNELESFQKIVGGYIECYPVTETCEIVCNEEGKILHLPYNFTFAGESFVGTIILVGVNNDDGEFCDCPFDEQDAAEIYKFSSAYSNPFLDIHTVVFRENKTNRCGEVLFNGGVKYYVTDYMNRRKFFVRNELGTETIISTLDKNREYDAFDYRGRKM